MLIGIAGMVGSGKTTLARALAARFGLQLALESVDEENPWLESFYSSDTAREYWEQLHARYSAWISAFRHCPVLFVDVREYDLFSDPAGAAEEIASRVRQRLERELPQTELWPAAPRSMPLFERTLQ